MTKTEKQLIGLLGVAVGVVATVVILRSPEGKKFLKSVIPSDLKARISEVLDRVKEKLDSEYKVAKKNISKVVTKASKNSKVKAVIAKVEMVTKKGKKLVKKVAKLNIKPVKVAKASVKKIVKKSNKKVGTKSVKATKVAKATKTNGLLKVMEKGRGYTQLELSKTAKIPYRSIRRYIDTYVKSKKIVESGYGKGKRFTKVG